MSLKENIDYIKEEISTQESFLEKFFKLEKFYKKYKVAMFSIVAIVIIGAIGIQVNSYMNEQNRLSANESFNRYIENSSDKKLLEELKQKSPKLYQLALYLTNSNDSVDNEYLKELVIYTKAIESKNLDAIATSTQNQKFLLKDFALFNKALIQAQNNDFADAKETLKMIPTTSNVASLVKMLEHYLLTK